MYDKIPRGDDWMYKAQLYEDGAAYTINPTDTVELNLIDCTNRQLVVTIPVLEATPGSDWTQGIIRASIPRATTINFATVWHDVEINVDNATLHKTWIQKKGVVVVETYNN